MTQSKIEWTDFTWNPWWGCDKVASENECANCYPIRIAMRGLHPVHNATVKDGEWTGIITRSSDAVWQSPFKWRSGRVFTCSMSDFFHERVPLPWFAEAIDIIERTSNLTYQVLTKRPGNVARKLQDIGRPLPKNVHLGVTIGHRDSLPLLKPLKCIEATLRFLSCEPLLTSLLPGLDLGGIGWVIAGGESGSTRLTDPIWVREIRDLCSDKQVPFFFKQWGHRENNPIAWEFELDKDAKGGATLDGRLWREFPPSAASSRAASETNRRRTQWRGA